MSVLFLCDCYDQFTWSSLTRWNACLACISMQLLSDVPRLVRLVVLVVSLFSSDLIACFLTFSDITFPPICITSCCGHSLLCVFSVWNAKCFISFQFFTTGFNSFQFYSTGINNFQFYLTGFNNFQFYSTGFNTFQFYYPVF